MAHFVTDRIVVGLQRTAAILAVLAVLVVAGGIGLAPLAKLPETEWIGLHLSDITEADLDA